MISINREHIAKAIGELVYEELLVLNTDENNRGFVEFGHARYEFDFYLGVWGWPAINPDSLVKWLNKDQSELRVDLFYIELKETLKVDDFFLAPFLAEVSSSLYAEGLRLNLPKRSIKDIFALTDEEMQAYFPGHPKILAHKGRVGWSIEDQRKYSPELSTGFQLIWLLVDKNLCSIESFIDIDQVIENSFCGRAKDELLDELKKHSVKDQVLLPVHPWQWENKIEYFYANEINNGKIVSLGVRGDFYQPQISLRSLTNLSRRNQLDIKLPLSILNTSAIRGLTKRHLQTAPELSQWVKKSIESDRFFDEHPTFVQQEVRGVYVQSGIFTELASSPYHYQEHLGAVWREPTSYFYDYSHKDTRVLMTGGLLFEQNNDSLIHFLIEESGLSAKDWVRAYCNSVLLPLYHLLRVHGIGVVAHGQNIQVILKNHIPSGLVIKDFGGDIRLSDRHHDSLFKNTSSPVFLPENYLFHDLFTGHLVTVMRFLSSLLHRHELLPEEQFYQILSEQITCYHSKHCVGETNHPLNLLQSPVAKVLVNRVRFEKGYAEQRERFAPVLGTPLVNPLKGIL